MAQQQDVGGGTIVLAFALGAVAGAALALLFAPATGRETREMVNRRAREASDRAREAARQGREEFNRQRENFNSAFNRARQGDTPEGEQEA